MLNPLMGAVRVEGKIGTQSLYASEAAGAVDAAVKMVSLDDAPQGDGKFSGVSKKLMIDPHGGVW
ncbi:MULTISPECIES: hypothetical protein [Pseudomonas syringae group]|uniref:hypothetical protein n=1 Tax=Pseudomonas syringae TaxID=317 RepID=UPI00040E9728|nr:hypothetical protein BKM17_20420 [Pseudomonas syringae group genomosp. 3]